MNQQNLKPLSTEKAREIGKKGGKKSVQVRREKKLMSQIYAEVMAKKHNAKGKTLSDVVDAVLDRGDSASVSMMKEMREATEGTKSKNYNYDMNALNDLEKLTTDQLLELREELINKTKKNEL